MSYDEDAVLLTKVSTSQNKNGFSIPDYEKTEVFVGKKSTSRSEHYHAMKEGRKSILTLGILTSEYEISTRMVEEEKVYPERIEYEGRTYRIARTYGEDKEEMELILEED